MTQLIHNSVLIERPVDDVFAFVVDPLTTSQWQSNLVRSELLTPGPLDVGTQVREVRRLGKAERAALWEVTTYERPFRRGYVYTQGFGPIQQTGETSFEETAQGTLIRFTAEIDAPFPLRLLLPFLARLMQGQNEKSFTTLKQVLEAREPREPRGTSPTINAAPTSHSNIQER